MAEIQTPNQNGQYIGDTFYGDPDRPTSPTHVWDRDDTTSARWINLDTEQPVEQKTYYERGMDASWFEKASTEDLIKQLRDVEMDLVDTDLGSLEDYMPITAIISACRIQLEQLNGIRS